MKKLGQSKGGGGRIVGWNGLLRIGQKKEVFESQLDQK